jgi:hypothetical protein
MDWHLGIWHKNNVIYSFICRDNVHEIDNFLVTDDIHILIISETNLDNTFDDIVEANTYNIYRRDRNDNGEV